MASSEGERRAIEAAERPATKDSLVSNLVQLGVEPDSTVMVHASLSALGWVAGGAQAVVEALLETVGTEGTIVMPAHSSQLSDPLHWKNPPLPRNWIDLTRAALPAFDPHLTLTRGMGQVPECFRCHPAAKRSSHPLLSFAAMGPHANLIVQNHPWAGFTISARAFCCWAWATRAIRPCIWPSIAPTGRRNGTSRRERQ
jgi:aminoglycoside 3-N-acetyltransferase